MNISPRRAHEHRIALKHRLRPKGPLPLSVRITSTGHADEEDEVTVTYTDGQVRGYKMLRPEVGDEPRR